MHVVLYGISFQKAQTVSVDAGIKKKKKNPTEFQNTKKPVDNVF